MAGTPEITQTRASYVCQTVHSTGVGESKLNALECIDVNSVSEGAIAEIATTQDMYRWDPASIAAPGATVVIPLGQSLGTPGRWVLVSSTLPAAEYYQFVQGVGLSNVLTPPAGTAVAAAQQTTMRFKNGDITDGGAYPIGYTQLTLHNQQVWFTDVLGNSVAENQRARLRFVASPDTSTSPISVTDEPATDSTVVTVYSASGIEYPGIIDVTAPPYNVVPDSRDAALNNTAAMNAALIEARDTGKQICLPEGTIHLAVETPVPDDSGYTYALQMPENVGRKGVSIKGVGKHRSILRYCDYDGAHPYDVVLHQPEVAGYGESALSFWEMDSFSIYGRDSLVNNNQAKYCWKSRKINSSIVYDCSFNYVNVSTVALDATWSMTFRDSEFSASNQHGMQLGKNYAQALSIQFERCSFHNNIGLGLFIKGGSNINIVGGDSQNNYGGGLFFFYCVSTNVDGMYFEHNCAANEDGIPRGINFTGVGRRYADIFFFRGTIGGTEAAWTYTYAVTGGPVTGHIDDRVGMNSASRIANCYTYLDATALDPAFAFISGNAANGLIIENNTNGPGLADNIYATGTHGYLYAWESDTYGVLGRFHAVGNNGFEPARPWGTPTSLWSSLHLGQVSQTTIEGTPRSNLLPADLTTLSLFDVTWGGSPTATTPVIAASASIKYLNKPTWQITAAYYSDALGVTIDVDANKTLANRLVYISCRQYRPDWQQILMYGYYDGTVRDAAGPSGDENGYVDPPATPNGQYSEWILYTRVVRLPASGSVKLGFCVSTENPTTLYFADPMIAIVGASIDDVQGAVGTGGGTGPTGPTGPTGATGPAGPAGAAGATGATGPTGPTGATGTGVPAGTDGQVMQVQGTTWTAQNYIETYAGNGQTHTFGYLRAGPNDYVISSKLLSLGVSLKVLTIDSMSERTIYIGDSTVNGWSQLILDSAAGSAMHLRVGGDPIFQLNSNYVYCNRPLTLSGYKVINLGTPSAAADAVNLGYIDPVVDSTLVTDTALNLLHLHFDGAAWTDSGVGAMTVTPSGSPTRDAIIKKFGDASLYTGNNSNNYLTIVNSTFAPEWDDFTIEFWYYVAVGVGVYSMHLACGDSALSEGVGWLLAQLNDGKMHFIASSTATSSWTCDAYANSTNDVVGLNAWHHCAVDRTRGLVRMYIDGTPQTATAYAPFIYSASLDSGNSKFRLGSYISQPMNGYLDEVRISGFARYKGQTFTPSSTAFANYSAPASPHNGQIRMGTQQRNYIYCARAAGFGMWKPLGFTP